MSFPAGALDDARLTVSRDFVQQLRLNRLDVFEGWYDETIVGVPRRRTDDRANLRVSIECGNGRRQVVYLKRHEPMRLPRRLLSWLRLRRPATPARDEWNSLFIISSFGIQTCVPVVLGEDPATGRSFIATAEIEDSRPADDFARERFGPSPLLSPPLAGERARARGESGNEKGDGPQEAGTVPLRRLFVRRLAEMVRRLHAAKLSHKDLYLCHVFVREVRGDFELRLIDLQRLGRFVLPRWRVKDVAQLEFSRPAGAFTRTDLARFLRVYFATDRLEAKHKRFARAVLRKVERIRRHERAEGDSGK